MVAASKECWRKWGLEQPLWKKNWQYTRGFPGGSEGKESVSTVEDLSLIPGLGRSPGGGSSWPPTVVFLPGESHGQRRSHRVGHY